MRTAREWSVPPRVILRGSAPQWTFVDRVLAVASVLADELRCSGCGQPKHEAWNPDSDGWYETHEETCHACAELNREVDKEYKFETKRWVMSARPADVQLRPWNPLD